MVDIKEIRKLSVEERMEMVEAIWDSIAEDSLSGGKLTNDQEVEISRRVDLLESGQIKTYSWDESKGKLNL
ncbi:MAG: addiction module protein [Cyclobacteriaceae bacterium]|jgi:putative addiction module component (TIGR02574 family)